ncbi:MAG: methyl-accepting chemotaxis protein, partial [Pseudomonadota bacterium]
ITDNLEPDMPKQGEKNPLVSASIVLAPLAMLLLGAALWFYQPVAGGERGDDVAAALATQLNATINGNNRSLSQFVTLTRSASPGGSTGEQARAVMSNEDRLRAFNDAAERLAAASAMLDERLAGSVDSSGALDTVRAGLTALDTQLAAIRGTPANSQRFARQMMTTAEELGVLVNALAGVDTGLDLAPLADLAIADMLSEQMIVIRSAVDALASDVVALERAGAARDRLAAAAATNISAQTTAAPSAITQQLAALWPWLPLGLIGVALVAFAVLAVGNLRSVGLQQVAREQSDQNERNQQAILRLLDELGSLADGDLTVEATVTEDITGAIADSINYAIEALRELVTTIGGTAALVDHSTKQTEQTAVNMNRAAQKQAMEIAAATESIAAIAASIEEVSGNAERSADVARHSVDVAHKGGDAVRRTIEGMNTIRETIQDTSKRIKRLGESSQEIGNIVELINDIAEQTNILALNASIQASMAGEAGRGFAVVADEVQRLAERSTNATKQIEVLVRTIQADTNEAVVSMERSTTDVVGGALLAENAGAALDEIEQVSNQIASLVQNIYGSARQQSQSAGDITRRTSSLKEISSQTSTAANATTASIARLAKLAGELRKSVSGFRLPDSANVTRFAPQVGAEPEQEAVVGREANSA